VEKRLQLFKDATVKSVFETFADELENNDMVVVKVEKKDNQQNDDKLEFDRDNTKTASISGDLKPVFREIDQWKKTHEQEC
jgi:hypothetical protein